MHRENQTHDHQQGTGEDSNELIIRSLHQTQMLTTLKPKSTASGISRFHVISVGRS